MVPVASWVGVWSMRSPTSVPGTISPSTRCAAITFCATLRPLTIASRLVLVHAV
jgi:hypothetical protein